MDVIFRGRIVVPVSRDLRGKSEWGVIPVRVDSSGWMYSREQKSFRK